MKKTFLTIIAFLLALSINAQEWVGINKSAHKRIQEKLISSSENSIIVDIDINGFYKETVKTDKGDMLIISGEDMAAMPIKGAPNLPMYPISMIVGDYAEMEIAIIKSEYVDFENVDVAPSKGNFSRQINPDDVPYTYGDMYQEDAFYPAQQASLGEPYILRDFRAQNMMVYPYSYNPVTKTLRVYTYMRIEAKKVSDNGVNQKVNRKRNNKVAPEVNALYERRFINYHSKETRYSFLEEEGEMLIVCVDEYAEALQPLVEWKNISGRPTSLVKLSDTGDNLKEYIESYYAENPELVYLLLVGEHNNLPAHPMSGGRSDNYFGMLEGDDYYEEVMVGRLSVKSVGDVVNQVNKIIHYERNIDETATWLSKAAGVAAKEGQGHYGEVDYEHMDFIRDTLLNYTYTEVSQYYANVNYPSSSQMVVDFSEGLGLINYCNHGSPESWAVANFTTKEVHRLTNDNKLPFIWSVACNNGQFDYDECFAEAWMRASNPNTGGLTGAIGGMFSWISQPWNPPMYAQDEMVAILTEWREGYKHTLGGASCNGNMFMMDMDPFEGPETHNTWILFGDPSLMIRTDVPKPLNITLPQQDLFVGMTQFNIGAEADYGIATLSFNGEILASAPIKNGVAELVFEPLKIEGKAKLVVMGYNRVTEVKEINVIPAETPYLIHTSHEIHEDNGALEYGKTTDISMRIKNVGKQATNNVTVTLGANSEYVTISKNNVQITTINANEEINLDKAFTVNINPGIPDETKIEFTVTCSNGTDTWTTMFYEYAYAPVFVINRVGMHSNKLAQPGEKSAIEIEFENVGNAVAYNVVTEAYSSSSDIEFEDISAVTEEVKVGESYVVTLDFNVAQSVLIGTVFDVICTVNADFVTESTNYELKVGLVGDNFETGDFSAHEWKIEGEGVWVIDSIKPYEGKYCVKSDNVSNNKYTRMKVQVDVVADGPLTFYVKTSSELYYDKLEFLVNSLAYKEWSGETDWEQYTHQLKKGSYTLEWRYRKDSSTSEGEDRAYVDNIVFPPICVVRILDAVTGLKYNIDNENLTLSWNAVENATEYLIRRDGELVATQTTTEFNDNVSDNIVTYTIVAKNGENYSEPAFIVVDPNNKSGVNVLDYEMNRISLYPNPTSGIIFVELDENFDAVVYNYQGQVMYKRYDNYGNLDLSDLRAGVYFLEIRMDDKVMVEKIIIDKQ